MAEIARLSTRDADFDARLARLTAFDAAQDETVDATVAEILAAVKRRGDAAVLEYTARFDGVTAGALAELELPRELLARARDQLPAVQREALEAAALRVRHYHEKQLAQSWQYTEVDGTVLGQKVTPLDRVGLYVPGGKAAYPSSVLMNALPAKVAGVAELVMVVPTPRGEKNALVLRNLTARCPKCRPVTELLLEQIHGWIFGSCGQGNRRLPVFGHIFQTDHFAPVQNRSPARHEGARLGP